MPGTYYDDRYWLSGAELKDPLLEADVYGGSVLAASDIKRSGSYSWRMRDYDYIGCRTPLSVDSFKASFFLNHSGTNGSPYLLTWRGGGGILGSFQIHSASGGWALRGEGGLLVASGTASQLTTSGTFQHYSLFVRHAPGGSFVLWIDGTPVASFAGSLGSCPIDEIRFGGGMLLYGKWNAYAYWDDFVVLSAVGDGSPVQASPRRLTYYPPRDQGASAAWQGSDGDSASNYLLVKTFDGDSTYVYAGSSGLTDSYRPMGASPTGSLLGVIPIAAARYEGEARQMRLGVASGASIAESNLLTLGASYGRAVWWGFGRNPWTGCPWQANDLANLEIVLRS